MTDKDFNDYHSRYHTYVHRIVKQNFPRLSFHDQEDLEQDVWLRVFRYDGLINKPEYFGSWVYQVVNNVGLDFLRRSHRKRYYTNEEITDDNTPRTPSHNTLNIEVTHLLQRLNKTRRTVLQLRFLEGMSVRETACETGMSESNVRVVTHKAVRDARKRLAVR